MRNIIYALGKLFQSNVNRIDWDHVIAVSDKKDILCGGTVNVPYIRPNEIVNQRYDYIIIFSTRYFDEIAEELSEKYLVPLTKIVQWYFLVPESQNIAFSLVNFIGRMIKSRKYKKVLDVGMSFLPDYISTRDFEEGWDDVCLDGLMVLDETQKSEIYNNTYLELDKCPEAYDLAVLPPQVNFSMDFFSILAKKAKRWILYSAYDLEEPSQLAYIQEHLQEEAKVKIITFPTGRYWLLEIDSRQVPKINVAIYIVTHKPYPIPRCSPYIPLCVGGYHQEGDISDDTGENIATLNPTLNEMTAIYWIWKNTKTDFVGINHYRRYFYNDSIKSNDNILDLEHATLYLSDHDIILGKGGSWASTVSQQFRSCVDNYLFEESYSIFESQIRNHQPNYVDAFIEVMNGHKSFYCNMFIMKWEVFHLYCDWLFSFLLEATRMIDTSDCDAYNKRMAGFFAERMLTVWLQRNKYNIKEMPYTYCEKVNPRFVWAV